MKRIKAFYEPEDGFRATIPSDEDFRSIMCLRNQPLAENEAGIEILKEINASISDEQSFQEEMLSLGLYIPDPQYYLRNKAEKNPKSAVKNK